MKSLLKISLLVLLAWPLVGFQGRAELYLKTAGKLQAKGNPGLALEYLGRAIEADPKLVQTYLSRGFLYLGQGKLELALGDFDRMILLEPDNPAHYLTRGLALSQSGARELAVQDFRTGCRLGESGACQLLSESESESAAGSSRANPAANPPSPVQ